MRDGPIDPVADRHRVAALAAELVSADQYLASSSDRPDETSRSVRNLVESVSGFGPLQTYLEDPTVEELWVK
jgi:pilus assembly protein CpaF